MGACLTEPEPTGPNEAPSAVIAAPAVSATYRGGDSIAYSGSAADREDGTVPESRLTWWAELHHDTHTHPFMPRTTGASGKLFVPPIGETSDNVFLRLYLEAMDDSGKADTVSRDILPQKVQFTLATDPGGLSVTLDGQPRVVPLTVTGVVGMERELGVTTPQTAGSTSYNFSSWSDGGAATHRISTPAAATTYTARFGAVVNQLPTVSITAPSSGAALTINTATTISATAADGDGTVSKVDFFDGATLLGTDTSSPYSLGWTPNTTGAHALTARATDNAGGITTSPGVNVNVNPAVNRLPTVSLTAPANGSSVTINTPLTLSANASDPDGSVAKVGFYDGSTLIGEDTSAPYSWSWVPTTTGSHTITARVTDNQAATASTTPAVSVTVNPAANQPPTASLTAPAAGATLVTGTATTLTATAADPDGTVSKVGFYDGSTLLGEDTSSPYSLSWTPATTGTGTRSLTARATDNQGSVGTSTPVSVTVNLPPNVNPTATLTAPANGATLPRGVATTLTATAADADGTVAKVGFYDGGTLLGEDTTSPYSFSWTPSTTGTHTLTARATDNRAGTGTSGAVNVTVNNRLPTATLTAPASGATLVVNNATTLTATAADPDGTVAKVGFYDGATLLGEDTTSPYSLSWTPTVTGGHSLTARATDNNGGVGNSSAVTVTVASSGPDTQAPTLTLTSPAGQATGITGSPTFTVTTTDNVGVTAVDYQVDGDAVGQATSAPWSFTLPATSAYTTGVHVIRARARDAAGNQSAWSAARVTFGGSEDIPNGFTRTIYAQGLNSLGTSMAFSPDGRLFICEQSGTLLVVKNGVLLSTPFVVVPTTQVGERGLLGVTFDPNFASNGFVYVYYTSATGGAHNRISRFTASGDVAVPGSEVIIRELSPLSTATNHNGGALAFGPDGKLYVAVGENANPSNAQLLTNIFGKMLRFNSDGSIPSDNPFFGSTSGISQSIWAYGLRNPFTFVFEPGSSTMFINDVGQDTWEEIDLGRAGANYGWPTSEGVTTNPSFDSPVFAYGHSSNSTLVTGNAIVGGAFYRPSTVQFPSSWVGQYFFGDYVAGWINRLDRANGNAVYAFARLGNLTDVRVGSDGALYVLADVGSGRWGVYRYSKP